MKNTIFAEKTFADCSLLLRQKATLPNFAEKTFKNSHKTVKFMKVFSLERFPLYFFSAEIRSLMVALWELRGVTAQLRTIFFSQDWKLSIHSEATCENRAECTPTYMRPSRRVEARRRRWSWQVCWRTVQWRTQSHPGGREEIIIHKYHMLDSRLHFFCQNVEESLRMRLPFQSVCALCFYAFSFSVSSFLLTSRKCESRRLFMTSWWIKFTSWFQPVASTHQHIKVHEPKVNNIFCKLLG